MSAAALRRMAWLLVGVAVTGAVGQAVLIGTAGVPLLSAAAVGEAFPIITLAVVVGAWVGAVIVARHPRHRIGWLFCVGQAGAAVGLAAQELALAGNARLFGAELGQTVGGLARVVGADYALALLGLLLLLVPDGRLPSRRWRAVAGVLVAGWALSVVALLMTPTPVGPAVVVKLVADLAVVVGLLGGTVALVMRLRAARGARRRQLRWIAAAATALAVAVLVLVAEGLLRAGAGPTPWPVEALFQLGYLAVPVATGFAVLRYRLYDIDVIIGRTVRVAALALFVVVGYVAAVVAVGTVLGGALLPSVVAYVVVALAFQPLRLRVDRFADRIVHGDRAAPYDSLAALTRSLREVPADDAALLRMVARSCAAAAGVAAARATVVSAAGEVSAGWPADDVADPGEPLPVRHGGVVIGHVTLAGPVPRSRRRLLDGLAAQAGLAFHNVALTAELRAQAAALAMVQDELAGSRRRLRVAVDGERERLATAIRAEVTVHLTPIPAALDRPDPDVLAAQREATERAIAALREITAGIVPPLLARRGLVAAVADAVARSADGATLALGDLADRRLDPAVETTAYLCCAAVLDAVPGARIGLDVRDGDLAIALPSEFVPPPAVLDRVEALGGQLVGEPFAVLLPASAHTAASRSGPKADLVT